MELGLRRLRSCLASMSPGGLGSPSAPTTRGCPFGLDAGRMKAAKAAGSGRRMPSVRPRKHGAGPEIAAVERRKACALRKARAAACVKARRMLRHGAFRRSAPSGDPGGKDLVSDEQHQSARGRARS